MVISGRGASEVAKAYGFNKAVSTSQLSARYPKAVPFCHDPGKSESIIENVRLDKFWVAARYDVLHLLASKHELPSCGMDQVVLIGKSLWSYSAELSWASLYYAMMAS